MVQSLPTRPITPQTNVSAFFIDTAARSDKSKGSGNLARKFTKTALLIIQLAALSYILSERSTLRRQAVILYSSIFIARILVQMAFFWHRRILWTEVWAEAGGVIPLTLASFAYGASHSDNAPFEAWDVAGGALFIFGTWLNIYPEYQRHLFKSAPENKGKLFTGGLWRYARRINYTGEIVSFIGFALATGPLYRIYNLWVPLVMGAAMASYSTNEIEHYLHLRYGHHWTKYKKQVRWKLIPGVF